MKLKILNKRLLSYGVIIILSLFFNRCPSQPMPGIDGTVYLPVQAPADAATFITGDSFQYAPPSQVKYLVLVIGDDSTGPAPLKVVGQKVLNVKYGCTTDLGMSLTLTSGSLVRNYNPATFTFSGAPTGTGAVSWILLGYDANMDLVASSPFMNLNVTSW